MAAAEPFAASNFITGKILNKESGQGVPDLLVELFDLEAWPDPEGREGGDRVAAPPAFDGDVGNLYKFAERIGSEITDRNGLVSFQISPADFNLPGRTEQKPDLIMVVLAPDEPGLTLAERLLHLTRDVYLNAGRREAYVIRLPSALLVKHEIATGQPRAESEAEGRARAGVFLGAREGERLFDQEVAAARAVQVHMEGEARKAFRNEIKAAITRDLALAPPPGEVADDTHTIAEKNETTTASGVQRLNKVLGPQSDAGVPVNLYLTPKDLADLAPHFANPVDGLVTIDAAEIDGLLFRTNSSENIGTLLVNANPIAAFCAEGSFDETCARRHTGMPGGEHHEGEEGSEEEEAEEVEAGSDVETIGDDDMPTYIARLIGNMPSPDRVLQPELIRKRATPEDLQADVARFTLPKGPAEDPAKYHFSTLEIAFEHVWKQLFDETIPDLAFTANTLGESRLGVPNLVQSAFLRGALINALFTVTPTEVPPEVAKHFDVTKNEYNELSHSHRDELAKIAGEISRRLAGRAARAPGGTIISILPVPDGPTALDLRLIQRLTEQGDRLIEAVRHDDHHTLHKTLRELNDRLNGAYEFTVFAADKDFHSVNFGLICTFEQEWTPLAIQPGRLVKTIPLTPKEERRYVIKTKRTEKRASKEAKKNNSALTSEQTSISRVEAEIMAKAHTKTNFGLTAEGDYDIGFASGKSTTTFGVEAANDSSQTRKDFREAVLKAVQEYRNEVSFEVSTDTELTVETEESGLITNTNDELSVTHLFYELQKLYRLAERLYRVMPVVLVAQEVPSPDQITPAWVLAHDWILRRSLLDDSFRPALDYLANNSVGDDFALREMRKNLRQQRNLVETLRVEFSVASVEADNRYTALARTIEARIEEEHAERSDGFFSDVGDFFGGGGQDPEAAKARELAAKDAHQYALERAEKAAAALREEINTLHSLTTAYNKTVQTRLDNETKVKRLLVHIRNNMLYYMQAIWSLEPPDQRFLRLHKVKVPVLKLASRSYKVAVDPEPADIFARFREPGTQKHKAFLKGTLEELPDEGGFATASLVEVADMTPVGAFGNYLAFRLKAHNALTEFMAAPYIDRAFGAMDPDELANVSLDQFSKYICCLHDRLTPEAFDELKDELREWLEKLMASPLRNGDEIVVPTGSLFIESLVDPNPVLEDFKLKHRELDVYKVQEEVRKAGLENLRLAARLLNDEREDPQIDKKILVEGGLMPSIDVDGPP
ncbi:hypothetical protein LJR225_001250 [Phenylobacterium sp. LjRoot225]|uniref:hypothetical protein n=1 Tax=Phenylobacterium sp. LjRoot225 TaxID=3342285 RepID=UPI003ED0715F